MPITEDRARPHAPPVEVGLALPAERSRPVPARPSRRVEAVRRPGPTMARTIAWAVVLAAALSLALVLFGPPGVDRAAHLYQTHAFEQYGWRVWDNYWYAGRYEIVTYSVLYYPLAAVVGETPVVLVSVLGSVALFGLVAARLLGDRARPSVVAFAATLPTLLVAGQYPFALGVLLALAALALLQRARYRLAVVAALGTLLASPLAFLLLATALAGVALGRPELIRSPGARTVGVGIVLLGLAELVALRVFPNGGRFPYPLLDLVGIVLFGAAGLWAARRARRGELAGVFVAYAAAGLGLFLLPSAVGGNVARLLDYFALPLLLLVLAPLHFRPRVFSVAALLVASLWQAVPVARDLRGGLEERAAAASYWAGTVAWLKAHPDSNYRVEVVATAGHWEGYHVAGQGIPLTRGWFRQDDFPVNEALYTRRLDEAGLVAWLRSMAVRYVVLPSEREQLDYSSQQEAAILRENPRRFRRVYGDATTPTQIFELREADRLPILSPQAPTRPVVPGQSTRVVYYDATSAVLYVAAPGIYDLRIRYSPYLRVEDAGTCLTSAGPSGMSRLYVHDPGLVRVAFDLTRRRAAGQALGAAAPNCAFPPIGRDGG